MTDLGRAHSKFMTCALYSPWALASSDFLRHGRDMTELEERHIGSIVIGWVLGAIVLVTALEFLNAYGIITP